MNNLKKTMASVAVLAALLSFASHASEFSPPKQLPVGGPKISKYTGWIEFKREFRVYKNKTDIGNTLDESCMSGYFFPKEKQARIMAKYNHKKVVVYGSDIDPHIMWNSGDGSGLASPIDNYCGSKTVILGLYIELAR